MVLLASAAGAQWKNIAPNWVHQGSMCGAMQYRDGIVWAGGDRSLWSSRDVGLTWQQSTSFPVAKIFDIDFYNRFVGLVATDSDVYRTTDGGRTWTISRADGDLRKVGFGNSSQMMFAMDYDGTFFTSSDGGQNWSPSVIPIDARSFAVASDGAIYIQATTPSSGSDPLGTVIASKDFGRSWSSGGQTFQFDCYSLSVDSCNPKQLCLVNEQIDATSAAGTGGIFVSNDGGISWNQVDSHPAPYFSGALATNRDAIVVGTVDGNNIRRSMDKGQTWNSIGGPALGSDNRNIAVVDDNIIFAADSTGSIWLTTNGGGDSASYTGPFSTTILSTDSLFANDTVRCDSLTSAIYLLGTGCRPPDPSSIQITGPDANSYRILGWNRDSIQVVISSQNPGPQTATLVVTFEDGTKQSATLGGYSAPPHALSFDASTLTVKTDTIGGEVAVPIKILGLTHPENVELVLHYQLPNLVYDSSVDRFGTKVDLLGEQWPGRSKLLIRNDTPGTVTAYAKFKVFSDTVFNPQVTFDSVEIPTEAVPCEYSPPPAVTATIYPLQGCTAPILSRWIHLGEKPLLRINPNPTSGTVSITSDETIGGVSIDVYDMLGSLRAQIPATIYAAMPTILTLPMESGAYYVRIVSSAGVQSVPVVINR